MRNKLLVLAVLVTTFLLTYPGLSRAGFNDVVSSHSNFDAIEYVKAQGIVEGYDDGTYQPERTINRAEFTKIVIESQFDRQTIDDCSETLFPDVPAGQWFTSYVCVAKANGIIEGYPDGTFRPSQNISFVEAAKIIVVTFQYSVETDVIWYKPFVEKLGEKAAVPTTIDRFEKNISRGEMAEMIYRLKAEVMTKASQTYQLLSGESVTEPTPEPTPNLPPAPAVKEFEITAKRFSFTPATITVQEGDTVRLIIESIDVTHGFSLSAFNVNGTLTPGQTKTFEFVADKVGTFTYACSIVCGSGHGGMRGTLIVESKQEASMSPAMTYVGTVLAGNESPMLDFKQEDYQAAMDANKTIVLYFYADWCPLCRNEVRDGTYPAFDELGPGLVGFQVNWRDGQDTDDEVELAREYGVSSQHTKIFIKNGERVLKTPELWTKERYLTEFENLLK